jgi:hypothetical protein
MVSKESGPRPRVSLDPQALRIWSIGDVTVYVGEPYGMVNLRDLPAGFGRRGETVAENRSKQGIFNHTLLVACATGDTLSRLAETGVPVDVSVGFTTQTISHMGTIPGGEYKDRINKGTIIVDNPSLFFDMPVELVGQAIVRSSRVPRRIWRALESFSSIGPNMDPDDSSYPGLEQFVAHYWDHRITDRIMPLTERMAGFVLGNHIKEQACSQQKEQVKRTFIRLVSEVKDMFRLRTIQGQKTFSVDKDTCQMAKRIAGVLRDEFSDVMIPSPRGTSLEHIVTLTLIDTQTELYLEKQGIDMSSNELPPRSTVEWYLRLLFIDQATPKVFAQVKKNLGKQLAPLFHRLHQVRELYYQETDASEREQHQVLRQRIEDDINSLLRQEFSNDTWWDTSMREKIMRYEGKAPKRRKGVHRGPRRGVIFLSHLQEKQVQEKQA